MHIGMAEAIKLERMNFRVRPDVKQDMLILAERRRGDLTELITHLLVAEIEKERELRPDLWKEAAKRVAERRQSRQPVAFRKESGVRVAPKDLKLKRAKVRRA